MYVETSWFVLIAMCSRVIYLCCKTLNQLFIVLSIYVCNGGAAGMYVHINNSALRSTMYMLESYMALHCRCHQVCDTGV